VEEKEEEAGLKRKKKREGGDPVLTHFRVVRGEIEGLTLSEKG